MVTTKAYKFLSQGGEGNSRPQSPSPQPIEIRGLDSRSWEHSTENSLNPLSFQILQLWGRALQRSYGKEDIPGTCHLFSTLDTSLGETGRCSATLCLPVRLFSNLNKRTGLETPKGPCLSSTPHWCRSQGQTHGRRTRNILSRGPLLKISLRTWVGSYQFLPQKFCA